MNYSGYSPSRTRVIHQDRKTISTLLDFTDEIITSLFVFQIGHNVIALPRPKSIKSIGDLVHMF